MIRISFDSIVIIIFSDMFRIRLFRRNNVEYLSFIYK